MRALGFAGLVSASVVGCNPDFGNPPHRDPLTEAGPAPHAPNDGSLPPPRGDDGVAPPPAPSAAEAGGRAESAATPGVCGRAGVTFCESFEDQVDGTPPEHFVVESGGGTAGPIVITTAVAAHSGDRSVHVDGSVFSSLMTLKGAPVFPTPDNRLYVRAWIRVGSALASGHSTFIEAGPDETSNDEEVRVGFHVNQLEVNRTPGDAEQLSNGGDYNDPSGGITFIPETWHCLEVLFDGAADELSVWFEDREVEELHVTDWHRGETDWSPEYAAVRFGYEKYSGPSMEVWYDDVAVGTERIGCTD